MALAVVSLATGVPAGLHRMGWATTGPTVGLAALHGPLMVCGFLGTLISLERAVALGRFWAYLAPVLIGAGALTLLLGDHAWAGPVLILSGSIVLVAVFVVVLRLQFQPFAVVMALGALSWTIGNALWLAGWPLFEVVAWWVGFLVLTIAGERLELSRMLFHAPGVQRMFLGLVAALIVGLILVPLASDTAYRMLGIVLIAMAGWLARYDIARYTVRQEGLTRFIAVCLLSGYAWLIVGGALLVVTGYSTGGYAYDASLHALLVGFVFSMIFGHAPIIFPSVLAVRVGYHPVYYGHLIVLHVSLLVRTAGNILEDPGLRLAGGLLNAAAIVLFLIVTAAVTVLGRWAERNEG